MNIITLVGHEGGDWRGLYVNDTLMMQDHEIDAFDALWIAKDHVPFEIKGKDANSEWFSARGDFPESLKDFQEA